MTCPALETPPHAPQVRISTTNYGDGAAAITTFASGHGLDGPWGLAIADGMLFVASFATDTIHRCVALRADWGWY